VSHLYNPLHPAVLRLICKTIRAGERAARPVSLCGEMAADVRFTRLLLGMGLREFSVPPAVLPEIKQVIRASHSGQLKQQIKRLMTWRDIDKISGLLEELNAVV
jgi:phosphoenolpyruvate-protein phosphotransferase (PTS system enzyme I)